MMVSDVIIAVQCETYSSKVRIVLKQYSKCIANVVMCGYSTVLLNAGFEFPN